LYPATVIISAPAFICTWSDFIVNILEIPIFNLCLY